MLGAAKRARRLQQHHGIVRPPARLEFVDGVHDGIDHRRLVRGQICRTHERDVGPGRPRRLGDPLAVGGDDDVVDGFGGERGLDGPGDEGFPAQESQILVGQPLRAASRWNQPEHSAPLVHARGPGIS